LFWEKVTFVWTPFPPVKKGLKVVPLPFWADPFDDPLVVKLVFVGNPPAPKGLLFDVTVGGVLWGWRLNNDAKGSKFELFDVVGWGVVLLLIDIDPVIFGVPKKNIWIVCERTIWSWRRSILNLTTK